MSTSSSLSSAKRRRAGGVENQTNQNTNVVQSAPTEKTKKLMSVQDVLYILNAKIENLSSKIVTNNVGNSQSEYSSDTINQITDSIDNMNNTLEQFSELLTEYNERIQKLEEAVKNSPVQDKIQQLEKRINEKILSKSSSDKFDILNKKKAISTKDKLADMVPNKKGVTVDDKFAEKTNQKNKSALKQFEEESAKADNVSISFSGLKQQIETNNNN